MPSDEGKQVLRLLAEGKIDADQAFRLLRALGDIPGAAPPRPPEPPAAPVPPGEPLPPGLKGRILRIQVLSGGKTKVNLAIPLAIARMGKVKMGASGLVKEQLARFGIDLDEVLRTVERSGPIVDISDNEDRVLIVVE
ncbi:MAG TPA: hypothetical protein VFW12_08775 [Candidatus Limnocylindria bacterium]|nr:hypothetical protein [Candidatus Limnocylindria bacterium]